MSKYHVVLLHSNTPRIMKDLKDTPVVFKISAPEVPALLIGQKDVHFLKKKGSKTGSQIRKRFENTLNPFNFFK